MTRFFSVVVLLLSIAFFCSSCDKQDDNDKVTSCDQWVVVDNDAYQNAEPPTFSIVSASIVDDCLTIEYAVSGCSGESMVANLIDANLIAESYPVQRSLKMTLANPELCLALLTLEKSFDIKALRVGDGPVRLHLDGFDKELLYSY